MRISTMYSAEKEDVELRENIYPTGNVEEWMLLIEKTMKESLRQIIRDSLEDYKKVRPCCCCSKLISKNINLTRFARRRELVGCLNGRDRW
jgi:hypothetical protein